MTDKPRHAGAPEDGIEVTREMIDAGCLELSMRNGLHPVPQTPS